MRRTKRFYFGTLIAATLLVPVAALAVVFTGNVQFSQNLSVIGSISKGSGTFVIDHPQKPKTHLLFHSFVESPDVKNIYDGVVKLDANGKGLILLPSYFEALNKDFRYQLTPIGGAMPNLHIEHEAGNNAFTIAGGTPKGKVSWQITGIRHDPYILAHPVIPEVEKGPNTVRDKGEYICPECYGK